MVETLQDKGRCVLVHNFSLCSFGSLEAYGKAETLWGGESITARKQDACLAWLFIQPQAVWLVLYTFRVDLPTSVAIPHANYFPCFLNLSLDLLGIVFLYLWRVKD